MYKWCTVSWVTLWFETLNGQSASTQTWPAAELRESERERESAE